MGEEHMFEEMTRSEACGVDRRVAGTAEAEESKATPISSLRHWDSNITLRTGVNEVGSGSGRERVMTMNFTLHLLLLMPMKDSQKYRSRVSHFKTRN